LGLLFNTDSAFIYIRDILGVAIECRA